MKCSFTYEHYKETLLAFVDDGYTVCGLETYARVHPERALIMRHDVDFCPGAAMKMRMIESLALIGSTFFFRTGARFYNLASANVAELVRSVANGGEVGLHFEYDARLDPTGADWLCQLNAQLSALERVTGEMASSVSLHCPTVGEDVHCELKKWLCDNKYTYAYSDELFREIKYISDSRGLWREACFCNWIGKVDRLQVLTHPIWWYNVSSGENY
jgi:hypothetical protein